ncbi:MAG: hypothetical protein SV375_12560, partial [Thermodesulfobacteriota bacterium]|nr:hypothetical protein [Thermodesulfobacteriota bacterium]
MDYRLHLKKTGKWLALTVAILIFLLSVLWGLLQTGPGKQLLAQRIAAALGKKTSFHIKIGKITGIIPFTVRLDKLIISDSRSEWLVVERAFLSWSPASLIRGKISIKEMGAAVVRLNHLPDKGNGKETRKQGTMSLPNAIPPLHVRRLVLERLYLGESILGSQALFTINGRLTAGDHREALRGSLHIDRKEGGKDLYHIDWFLKGQKKPELELAVRVEEEKEGLLTRVLALKEAGSVTISLKGSGPVSLWKGNMTARADSLGVIETSLEFMIHKGLRLKGDGQITASRKLFEKDLQPLMMSRKTLFHFDSRVRDGNDIELRRVFLENDGISFKLAGTSNLEKKQIESDFNIRIEDLSCFNGLLKNRARGKMDLKGRVTGNLQQPEAILSVKLKEPGLGELSASKMAFDAILTPSMRGLSDFQGLEARVTGLVAGLTHKTRGPLIPGKECRWVLEGGLKKGDVIDIKKLDVSAEDFEARFSGLIDSGTSGIHGHAFLDIYDLASLSPITGTKVRGNLRMDAYLKGDLLTQSFSADMKGRISRFAPLPALLAPLAEEEVTYACHAGLEAGRHLRLTDLMLRSAEAEMRAEVSLDLEEKGISAKGKLNIPSLAILSKPAERPLDGALQMEVDVSGALSAPTIKAHAAVRRVRMEDINIPEVSLSLLARNVPNKAEGDVQVQVQGQGYSLKAVSSFTFIHPLLSLNNLSVSAPGTEVTGDLKIRLQGPLFSGVLRGSSKDLLSVSSLFGSKIYGKAEFHAELSEVNGRQNIALDLRGEGLGDGHGTIETLALSTRLKNLLQAPEGAAEVQINAFKKGTMEVHHMVLKAEGQKRQAEFTAHASGHCHEDFKFEAVGSVQSIRGAQNLRISLLKGNFGSLAFTASTPLMIRKAFDHYILEGADIKLGEGRFSARGRAGPESLNFNAKLHGLPLSFLQSFGYPELVGTAMARIHIEGRMSNPEADMELQIREITLKDP